MNDIQAFRLAPGKPVRLSDFDPNETGPFRKKKDAREQLERERRRLRELQDVLYAEGKHALLRKMLVNNLSASAVVCVNCRMCCMLRGSTRS